VEAAKFIDAARVHSSAFKKDKYSGRVFAAGCINPNLPAKLRHCCDAANEKRRLPEQSAHPAHGLARQGSCLTGGDAIGLGLVYEVDFTLI